VVDADRLWTAAELEGLSPNERRDLLNQRVVTDLSLVPVDVLERARSTGKALMEAHRPTHTAR
jgi:hypothetical protein